MESPNITSITDDAHLELSDSSFSNKVFARNFDKYNYLKHRNHYILSLAEEHIIQKQVIDLKKKISKKKNQLELRHKKTQNYRANLIELEIQNTTMMQSEVNNVIEDNKKYAQKLRNNLCGICQNLIFGKPKCIRKLINTNAKIGDWVYKEKPDLPCKLICNHIFHSKCISTWYKRNNSCPVCRHKVPLWQPISTEVNSVFTIGSDVSDVSDISDISDITDDTNVLNHQNEETHWLINQNESENENENENMIIGTEQSGATII
jgi:hypothetical protein